MNLYKELKSLSIGLDLELKGMAKDIKVAVRSGNYQEAANLEERFDCLEGCIGKIETLIYNYKSHCHDFDIKK